MKVDCHSHFYPKEYLKELLRYPTTIYYPHPITRSMWDAKKRLRDMEKSGIDIQIISLGNPFVDFDISKSLDLARLVNDRISEIVNKYPKRFVGIATLPFLLIEDTLHEFDRAIKELGLKAVVMGSNINGKPLDSKIFKPFYERATKLRVPIFIHPTTPTAMSFMQDYRLTPIIGFPFETTIAATRLVLSGVLEKYSNLKCILAHGGGAIPYLLGRIDEGHRAFSECKINISRPPSKYFKLFYYDTILFHQPALKCAYESVGSNRLLFGSDYPFTLGHVEQIIRNIEAMNIVKNEKNDILGANTMGLMGIL